MDRLIKAIDLILIVLIPVALGLAFLYAPEESTMGDAQRIFYFHVPFALNSFVAFGIVLVCSIAYLVQRSPRFDAAAHAAVEVGWLFCSLVLLTGPVWAKYAWGVYWTWDARLTSTLMLWLIFASYLFVRTYLEGDLRTPRYAAGIGILGALNVPIVYYSARWFETQHPTPDVVRTLGPEMSRSLWTAMLAVFLLLLSLWAKKTRILRLEQQKAALESRLEEEPSS